MNVLILGPFLDAAKAVESARGNVALLWGGAGFVRRLADLQSGNPLCQQGQFIDNSSFLAVFRGALEIAAVVKKKGFDVIHANAVHHLLKAWMAKRLLGNKVQNIKIAISLHNSLAWVSPKQFHKQKIITQLIRFFSDIAITIAEFNRQKLLSHGLSPERAITVGNAIDLEEFDKRSETVINPLKSIKEDTYPTVSYIAALNPWKGHDSFLQAAKIILAEYPEAIFLIIGDGPVRTQVEQYAGVLGIAERVIFAGNVPPAEVPGILKETDVPVCPSESEMCPFYILEAMAAGKAMVATKAGGIPELLCDGISGILVPPGDATALADGILALLKDPIRSEVLGKAARKFVETHHSLPAIGGKLMQAYRMLRFF